ncbi:hypothetical protein A5662_12575 [Mycobacteriaceae bacterium 1482268.1]|nr:hypothetical protein A5662_12575 [Mycobacteriaceae bacterium 1482268.1]
MDEIERSNKKIKARPVGGFEQARRSPAWVLIGLAVGIAATLLVGVYLWYYALIVPFLIGGVTVLFRRTQAFGLGVLAAGCGTVVFLVTLAVMFTVF